MYGLISIISYLIRQFVLPNPFTPLGENAEAINCIFGALLVPISYVMTGLIYDRGSAPALGSFLFFVVYELNTGITYLICSAYPIKWLMILITITYFVLYIFTANKIKEGL